MTRPPFLKFAGAAVTILGLVWPPEKAHAIPAADPAEQAAEPKDQSEQGVWLVEVIRPPVFQHANRQDKDGKELVAKPEACDNVHKLLAGTWVRCGPGGKFKVFRSPKSEYHEGTDWVPLPHLPVPRRKLVDDVGDDIIRPAGRLLDDPMVLFPLPSHAVRLESLVFLWKPRPSGQKVSLELRTTVREATLWEKDEIDGTAGRYADPSVRDVLHRWRDNRRPDDTDRVTLIFKAGDGKVIVPFDVMTKEQEEELRRVLSEYDAMGEEVRHLGRAAVFWQNHLFPESAVEYELALKLDPDDPILRWRTGQANLLICNETRAKQLGKTKSTP